MTVETEERTAREQLRRMDKARRARERSQREADREAVQRVRAYQAWTRRDAEAWAAWRAGQIDRDNYRRRSGVMPRVPTAGDYAAARRNGVA